MKKIFWIDMEMTGLDVNKEVIIEVGVIITDFKLDTLDSYHAIVKQDQQYIDNMDEWNKKHHTESSLIELIPTGRYPHQVENDLISLCEEHFPQEKIILAGNSIAQDRLFISKYFPRLAQKLHHRMLDVSSFKIVFSDFFNCPYEKKVSQHRAIDDIKASIEELKEYLKYITPPENLNNKAANPSSN